MNDVERRFVEQLYADMAAGLFRYAKFALRDDELAREAVQDVFRDLCAKVRTVMTHPNPQAWLTSAMRLAIKNISARLVRERNLILRMVERRLPEDDEQVDALSPDLLYADLRQNEDFALLRQFAEAGCTVAEFAGSIGISVDACNKRLQRARARLRKLFE